MKTDPLNEREFELINIVGADLGANQRDLSKHLNLSLGMTNMLIRRLISKGYIRIRQLNKRKVEYILTPKGFSEKMRKSFKYTVKTISSITLIKDQIKDLITRCYEKGEKNFFVVGESDLALLIELIFKALPFNGCRLTYIKQIPHEEPQEGIVLICKEEYPPLEEHSPRLIYVVKELAKIHSGNNNMDHGKNEKEPIWNG